MNFMSALEGNETALHFLIDTLMAIKQKLM